MTIPAKTIVDSFREAIQDLLVSELKAMRVTMDALRTEIQLRDERTQESIRNLSQKLDYAIDIRERLAALEARLPRH